MKATFVPLLFLLSIVGFAQQHPAPEGKPNLTGTWVFNAKKSKLKVAAPQAMTLRIDQKDGHVQLARTQTYGGQKFDWKFDAVPDVNKEVVQNDPQYTAAIKLYWQGDTLVLDQKLTASDGTVANDLVTYSLEGDGITMLALEKMETVGGTGVAINRWVYDKTSQ